MNPDRTNQGEIEEWRKQNELKRVRRNLLGVEDFGWMWIERQEMKKLRRNLLGVKDDVVVVRDFWWGGRKDG